MAETTQGIRAILSSPFVYRTFQRLLGAARSKRRLVAESFRPGPACACWTSRADRATCWTICRRTSADEGFDHEGTYIDEARERYGHRARFHHGGVSEMLGRADTLGPYDLVTAVGVLHHLDDETVRDLMGSPTACWRRAGDW